MGAKIDANTTQFKVDFDQEGSSLEGASFIEALCSH